VKTEQQLDDMVDGLEDFLRGGVSASDVGMWVAVAAWTLGWDKPMNKKMAAAWKIFDNAQEMGRKRRIREAEQN